MILPRTRSHCCVGGRKLLLILFWVLIFNFQFSVFNLREAHAVPNDGTYYLQANTQMGGAGTAISSTDYKVTNFTLGEVAGGNPKGSDTASACETGGSGVCKINPGWLFTRTKFASSGNFSSKDILLGESAQTIDSFTYRMTVLPAGTGATIQFSQDGSSWYNSAGVLNGSNTLSAGTNTISLSALAWTAGTFYYKVVYSGPGSKTPSLDSVVLVYGSTVAKIRPIFVVSSTDGQNDYLRYKIKLCTDVAMTASCQTFDQTASQAGWSGQNAVGSSAYLSGYQAFYTMQADLTRGLTYYWQSWAIDPAGSNAWSTASTAASFTTNGPPSAPTISAPATGATGVGATPAITLSATDGGGDWLRYKIQLATDASFSQNLSTFDQTTSQTGWSGQNRQTSTAYTSGSNATYTVASALLSGKRYFLRAYAIDPAGSNAWSNASTTTTFLTAGVVAGPCTSQPGGDYYVDENCSYTGSSEGVEAGNLTVRTGSTFTLNANQSIVWNPGQAITIQPGASIAINSSSKLTQSYVYTASSGTTGYPDPIGFSGATAVYHMDDSCGCSGSGCTGTTYCTGGGTVFNATGSNHGTATGTTIASGKFGNGRSFSGSSEYITIGVPLTPTGSKTIAFWINTTASTNQVVYDNSGNSSAGNGITIDINSTPGKIRVMHAKGTPGTYNYSVVSSASINDGSWHHIAYTWDGTATAGGVKLYIDGTQNATGVAASTTDNTPTNNLRLGAVSGGSPGSYFSGNLDEVQIFNRALSSMEITGMSNPPSSGMQFMFQSTNPDPNSYRRRKDVYSAASPIGEWKLDEQSGTGAYLQNTALRQF